MSKEKLVDISPFKKDIQKYLCEGYSPKEISKWIKTQSDNEDDYISEGTLRNYKKEYCPHIKWNRKKLVPEDTQKPKPTSKKETVQTKYVVKEEHDVTPEETVQKLLNIIFYNCENFKDGNVVQALSAVARLINDKELEAIDVEDTMRRFVNNDTLNRKIKNARYE